MTGLNTDRHEAIHQLLYQGCRPDGNHRATGAVWRARDLHPHRKLPLPGLRAKTENISARTCPVIRMRCHHNAAGKLSMASPCTRPGRIIQDATTRRPLHPGHATATAVLEILMVLDVRRT